MKKKIFLLLISCMVVAVLLGGCKNLIPRRTVTEPEPEYPVEEIPPAGENETAELTEVIIEFEESVSEPAEGIIIDIGPKTEQDAAARKYEEVSEDFVNTFTAVMLNLLVNNISVTPQDIEELQEITSALGEFQDRMEQDDSLTLDVLEEIEQRLADLRQVLFIQPTNFTTLRLSEPEKIGDRYVVLSGIWLREARLALRDLERHKKMGANTIMITVPLDCDADLNFSTPSHEVIAMYVQAAHASGMRVLLTLCQGPPAGYSRGWHDAYFGEGREVSGKAVLDALTPFVMEWAEFAEEFQVELFMPLVEPIMWASMDTVYWEMDDQRANEVCGAVSEWMQEILPGIKERYSRELMFATHNRVTGNSPYFELDFTGYDYIANWESGGQIVTQLSQECLSSDTCRGLIHHITLYVGGLDFEPAYVLTEEEQSTAYDEFFRQTWDNEATAGVMLDLGVGKEYLDRPAEEVVTSWLTGTPKVPSRNLEILWTIEGLFDVMDKILSPDEITYSDEWLEPPSHN